MICNVIISHVQSFHCSTIVQFPLLHSNLIFKYACLSLEYVLQVTYVTFWATGK